MICHFRKLLDRALVVYRRATLRLWKKHQRTSSKKWTRQSLQIVQEVSINNDFSKNDASTFQHRRSLCLSLYFFLVENRYFKQIFGNSVQSVAKIHILYVVVVLKYSTCFENNSFNPEIPIDQSDNMDPCVW